MLVWHINLSGELLQINLTLCFEFEGIYSFVWYSRMCSFSKRGILMQLFSVEFLRFLLWNLQYQCPTWAELQRLTESVFEIQKISFTVLQGTNCLREFRHIMNEISIDDFNGWGGEMSAQRYYSKTQLPKLHELINNLMWSEVNWFRKGQRLRTP